MRRGIAISDNAQTGQSEAIHSPEAWASTVVSDTVWMSWSMMVVCNVAISCCPNPTFPTGPLILEFCRQKLNLFKGR
jgi:hypothetical protein